MLIFTRTLQFQRQHVRKNNQKYNKHKIFDKQNYVFAGQWNLEGKHDVYWSVLDVLKNYAYTVKKVIGFPVPSRDDTNQTLPGGE